MATNQESKFQNFTFDLDNGMKITGIEYSPPKTKTTNPFRPLVVLIHGGTCTAHNFDVSPSNTASIAADHLSIPVVSINRPGYLDSSPVPKVSEGSTYHQVLGKEVLHENLFPLIWERYGKPAGCTSLVLMAHSIGSMGIIIAAGLHAQEKNPKYSLSGIIFSGWGCRLGKGAPKWPTTAEEKLAWKNTIMLTYPEKDLVEPEVLSCVAPQDHAIDNGERDEIYTGIWSGYWRKYSDQIVVPVMFGVGEYDVLWDGSLDHVKEYETMFPNSVRFDGSQVLGAPHAIEWSLCAQGWYARCFGFAAEVAVLHGLKMQGVDK